MDALPPKRRAFVLAYVGKAAGNATEAARIAGYAKPGEEGYRLLKNAQVSAAVDLYAKAATSKAVMGIEELRAFWSAVARGEMKETRVTDVGLVLEVPARMADRLKATELLGKSQRAFVEQVEHTGATVNVAVVIQDESRRRALAKGDGE